MIEEVLARLAAAGLDPDLRELRDALWLAQHVVPVPAATARPESRARSKRKPQVGRGDEELDQAEDPDLPALPSVATAAGAELHAAGPGGGRSIRAMEARSPAVPALRHQLQLSRALRPLKRRRPSRTSYVIDEEATAAQAAEEGIWFPAFRPAPARWLELELVVDTAPSMAVWRRTSAGLKNLLQQLGGFRSIRESFIDSSTGDTAGAGLLTLDRTGRPHDLATPAGPGHHRAILLVTDAVGAAWRSGQMDKVLRTWGATVPTTVVTVLPQRMWPGSGLRAIPGQLRAVTAEAASPIMASRTRTRQDAPADLAPISVMELSARWLAPWAELLAGSPGWRNAALLQTPDAAVPKPTLRRKPTPGDAADIVRQFRASASPLAFQLACYLSATGLNLPVMRLVQRVMLPKSDTAHLAEVFLSGLLRVMPSGDDTIEEEAVQYDFLPEVRDELNHYLVRDEMLDVVRETSRFVAERFGQPLDFSALLTDPAGAPLPALGGDQAPPLAYVSATVLAKLGGRYQVLAQRLATAAAEHVKALGRAAAASPHTASKPPVEQDSPRPTSRHTPKSAPATLRPYFYLSYARMPRADPTDKSDPDRWVYKLYEDLCMDILSLTDVSPEEAGFMDRKIRLGVEWSSEVTAALAGCRVFVPLYSPRYFASEQCGQEWSAFSRRQADQAAQGHLEYSQCIVPALWVRLHPDTIPAVAQAIQYDHPSFGERYVNEGFYGIMKLRNYRADYQRAIFRLAQRIVEVAHEVDLPPSPLSIVNPPLGSDSLASAFGPSATASASPPTSQTIVAADPPKDIAPAEPAQPRLRAPFWRQRERHQNGTYQIRLAIENDITAVLDLIDSTATWLRTKDTDQWARPWPDRPMRDARVEQGIRDGLTWMVDDGDGTVMATITCREHGNDRIWAAAELAEPSVYVSRVIVDRSYAGLGIGAALIDWAGLRGLREWGANWIRVEVWTTNLQLHRYFRSQGFGHIRTLEFADFQEYPEAALFQKPTADTDPAAASLFEEMPP